MRWKKSIVCSCGNYILVKGNNPKYETHTTIECHRCLKDHKIRILPDIVSEILLYLEEK